MLVLFVGFIFLTSHSIGAYQFAHNPHEIFLCIIGPDVDSNPMLAEAVLKDFNNVQA